MLLNNVTLFILSFLNATIELTRDIFKSLLGIFSWKFSKMMLPNSASMPYLEFIFVDQHAIEKNKTIENGY